MRMTHTLGVATLMLVVLFTPTSGAIQASGAPTRTLTLGFVGTLSGAVAMNGQLSSRGGLLAVDEINAAGGLKVKGVRYRLRMQLEDDAASPVNGVNAVSKLIGSDHVSAVFGPEFSDVVIPTLNVTAQHKVPQFFSTNSSFGPGVRTRYAFRLRVRDTRLSRTIANYVAALPGTHKAGLSLLNNPYGHSGGDLLNADLRARHIPVVATTEHNFGDRDLTSNAAAMVRGNADVVVSWTGPVESILLYRSLRNFGWHGTFMHVNPDSIYAAIGKSDVEGVVGPQGWSPADKNALSRHFVAAYKEKFGGQTPDEHSAAYYDGVRLFAKAVTTVGTNPDKIRAYISHLTKWQGLQGVFRPARLKNGDMITSVVMVKIRGGELQIIKRYN
jgi:branched-chain amino acid transport system substrate-binding protein